MLRPASPSTCPDCHSPNPARRLPLQIGRDVISCRNNTWHRDRDCPACGATERGPNILPSCTSGWHSAVSATNPNGYTPDEAPPSEGAAPVAPRLVVRPYIALLEVRYTTSLGGGEAPSHRHVEAYDAADARTQVEVTLQRGRIGQHIVLTELAPAAALAPIWWRRTRCAQCRAHCSPEDAAW